jgi:hypothetical protein
MIYDYVYDLITTLFIDITLLSDNVAFFLELFMVLLSAYIFRLMLSPIFYLFRISAAQYRSIMPKEKIRSRRFNND